MSPLSSAATELGASQHRPTDCFTMAVYIPCMPRNYVTTKTRLYFVLPVRKSASTRTTNKGLLCTEAGASAGGTGANE